jgi:hypothetical protein
VHRRVRRAATVLATARCFPAVAAGVTRKIWDIVDIVTMIEDWENNWRSIAN